MLAFIGVAIGSRVCRPRFQQPRPSHATALDPVGTTGVDRMMERRAKGLASEATIGYPQREDGIPVDGRALNATFYAIVNGTAGGGRCARLAPTALDELRRQGIGLDVTFTKEPKHATELACRAASNGHRRFLSVGGDGTAAEIVDGLMRAGASESCELAMLPLGTGNSFLRDFGIADLEAATEAVIRGTSTAIDVLRLTHEQGVVHFINTMGTGFVARAGELTNQRFKSLGASGYAAAVLFCVFGLRYEHNGLRCDGVIDDAKTVLTSISNSKYTGGSMQMAPDAQVADGLLDVVRVGPLGRAALVAAFPRIFSGTHTGLEQVWTKQVERVEFVNPSFQAVLIDGDVFHLRPLWVDVMPRALRLVA